MRKVFLSGLALVPLMVLACGGSGNVNLGGAGGSGGSGGNGSGGTTSGALPCDVADIVKAKCQGCHASSPIYGAPMPLVTAADFAAAAKSDSSKNVAQTVLERIHDSAKPMPPPPTTLDASELATLDAWIAAGAPAGNDSCSTTGGSGGGGSGGGMSAACTPDFSLRAKTPWTMPKTTGDEYVCVGADIVVSEKRHITTISPVINNNVILHHMLLYETSTAYSPDPTPCGTGVGAQGRLVAVWAPGGQPMVFPPEAGLPLEGTKHYLMQMHYSNLMQLEGETDLSGFDVCTTTQLRPNDADIMAFGTTKIDIAPNSTYDRTCDLTVPGLIPPVNVFYSMPHMHTIGTAIQSEVQHQDGTTTILSDRVPWSFDDQYWDKVTTTINPGDKVRVRCAWQNPTAQSVGFGEKTSDEMCFQFVAYYPRISIPGWIWGAPAAGSQCVNTP